MNQRSERVAELIHRNLSSMIVFEMRDPRIQHVTITQVKLTPDLQLAKVYFTWTGPAEGRKELRSVLNHASGFLRSKLSEKIDLKYMPQLMFYYDDSSAHMERMEELFKEIRKRD